MYYSITGVMEIVAAMTVIVIHALLDMDLSMKTGYTALAKCVVVSQRQKQQTELSGEESSEATDQKKTNGAEKQIITLFFQLKLRLLAILTREMEDIENMT